VLGEVTIFLLLVEVAATVTRAWVLVTMLTMLSSLLNQLQPICCTYIKGE
jgi:hypothetical protein